MATRRAWFSRTSGAQCLHAFLVSAPGRDAAAWHMILDCASAADLMHDLNSPFATLLHGCRHQAQHSWFRSWLAAVYCCKCGNTAAGVQAPHIWGASIPGPAAHGARVHLVQMQRHGGPPGSRMMPAAEAGVQPACGGGERSPQCKGTSSSMRCQACSQIGMDSCC